MIKKINITLGIIFITLLSISFVSAEFWLCLERGEIMEYCNNYKPDFTCGIENGCERCMSVYNEIENCYIHGSWPKCNQIPKECSFGQNQTIDGVPPEFNLISPAQDALYTSRSFLVEFNLNERADVYYIDNINGRGRWTKVCNDCLPGDPAYKRKRSFKEGFNDITFKAVDVVGNTVIINRTFFVDSKDPRISKTYPKRGFADGQFEVQFKENNPKILILHYGIPGDMRNKTLNLTEDCHEERSKTYCDTDVNLTYFNGEKIEYWFVLTDRAGNVDDSRHVLVSVDTTDPVIENLANDSFWSQGAGRYNKYIYFAFNITEDNLDEVFYTYRDSRGKEREKRLCSRLKYGGEGVPEGVGICETKKSFKKGHHEIVVGVLDEAGNLVGVPIEFDVDY